MKLDLHSQYDAVTALSPSATSDNTALTGAIIDMQNYAGAEMILQSGSLADADATFAVSFKESANSNMSSSNEVDAADLIGSVPAPTFASDNLIWKWGYKGIKRYVQIVITPTGNASAANFSAVAFLKKRKG